MKTLPSPIPSYSINFFIGGLVLFFISCQPKRSTSKTEFGTQSWMLSPFVKQEELFPLLKTDTTSFYCPVTKSIVKWQETFVFNPAAVVRNNKVYLIFRGEDKIGKHGGTSRLGLAESTDGLHFKKYANPILYPDNDAFLDYEKEGGCEDPRIVETEDGTYILTYTAFNGTLARLCIASSKDLLSWKKHGLAFGKSKANYSNLWSKSGAIVCKRVGDKLIATKINGKYWMYWGETDIFLATSDNLIDWEPVIKEEKRGKILSAYLGNGHYNLQFDSSNYYFKTAISIREKRFDSGLVEPGPPAILTDDGIFFIYNASNSGQRGDSLLVAAEYTVGQAMFDKRDPSAIINRCENYFIRSMRKDEISGQMSNTAFSEALVHFNNQWFLYYVMGEAGIGVAVCTKSID